MKEADHHSHDHYEVPGVLKEHISTFREEFPRHREDTRKHFGTERRTGRGRSGIQGHRSGNRTGGRPLGRSATPHRKRHSSRKKSLSRWILNGRNLPSLRPAPRPSPTREAHRQAGPEHSVSSTGPGGKIPRPPSGSRVGRPAALHFRAQPTTPRLCNLVPPRLSRNSRPWSASGGNRPNRP